MGSGTLSARRFHLGAPTNLRSTHLVGASRMHLFPESLVCLKKQNIPLSSFCPCCVGPYTSEAFCPSRLLGPGNRHLELSLSPTQGATSNIKTYLRYFYINQLIAESLIKMRLRNGRRGECDKYTNGMDLQLTPRGKKKEIILTKLRTIIS